MFWSTVFGVLTAVFAVFGAVCTVRMLADSLFPVRQLAVAVEICDREDADVLDMLLHEAQLASACAGGARLVVLLPEALAPGDEIPEDLEAVLERYHAECYLIGS